MERARIANTNIEVTIGNDVVLLVGWTRTGSPHVTVKGTVRGIRQSMHDDVEFTELLVKYLGDPNPAQWDLATRFAPYRGATRGNPRVARRLYPELCWPRWKQEHTPQDGLDPWWRHPVNDHRGGLNAKETRQ